MYYSGIGSRETSELVLHQMTLLAHELNHMGYILRSGGAIGADTAFKTGSGKMHTIYRPQHAFGKAIEIASQHHPAWHRCNEYVQKLHGRNVLILLGDELDEPSKFVVCWTSNGKDIGGTGLGIRVAKHYGIKTFNLFSDESTDVLEYAKNIQ